MRARIAVLLLVFFLPPLLLLAADGLSAARVRFSESLIHKGYGYAFGIAAADLDGDGDLDLVSADATGDVLLWFENDGKGNFTRRVIQDREPGWFERMSIGDVDGDGKPDVCVVKNLHGGVVWFQNLGKSKAGLAWKRHVVASGTLPGAYDVVLADLDGDGKLDVAASTWRKGNQFVWFHNSGKPTSDKVWQMHVIDTGMAETRTIRAGDFDRDGKMDLLGTATVAGVVAWYQNPGKVGAAWKKHVIDDVAYQPTHGHPVDLDGDGDLDVVMALGFNGADEKGQVAWYENVGKASKGSTWKKHVIGALPRAFEAVAADIDGDGHLDVVASSWGTKPGGQIVWFANPGKSGGKWTRHVLKSEWTRANQVIVADFDGNGKPDIAATAERPINELRWWRNEGRKKE